MKHPDSGLWREVGLRNNYLPLLFATVLLLSAFSVQSQSYTTVNGRFNYADSIKFSKLKNNAAKDSVLATDSTGRIILKYINPISASAEANGEYYTNSVSQTITLLNTPIYNTLKLIKNGIRLPPYKYSLSVGAITLTDIRVITDIFQADYKF